MTHLEDSNALIAVVELLAENGFEGMAEAMQILLNEAMKLQRSAVLGARPYERSKTRRGHANGFKPKSVNSRLGKLALSVPQTRGIEFYPSALERGERSERALKLAIAELRHDRFSSERSTWLIEQRELDQDPERTSQRYTARNQSTQSR